MSWFRERLIPLRERLALAIAPWLDPLPETEEHDLPAYIVTTTTTTGAHAFWRQTG